MSAVVGLFGTFVGLCTLISVLSKVRRGMERAQWAAVKARVTKIGIDDRSCDELGKVCTPVIQYSYVVNGVCFVSNQIRCEEIAFADCSRSKTAIQRYLDSYDPGREVRVYFNPDNPSECVLDRRVSTIEFLPHVLITVVFSTLGIFTIIEGL